MALDDATPKWFATELNTTAFPVLGDNVAHEIKTSLLLRPDEKATKMFNALYNRAKVDPSTKDKFVVILEKDKPRYNFLIEKLQGMVICFTSENTNQWSVVTSLKL
jgi:hypothetical protein